MKKVVLAIAATLAFGASAYAKQVTVCDTKGYSVYVIEATSRLTCAGNFNGVSTIIELYKKGWTLVTGIQRDNTVALIFEK
ncbi:MAG: hypothetical protein LBP89_04040 [Helicobacteraceae bacterium]|nr:hypothetical protein [Helicobacteraceae bacterium]